MIRVEAPVALHDIIQASINMPSGVKPIPLSMKPGEAPMRAVPVHIALRANGTVFVLMPTSMVLSPHVKVNDDPDKRTAAMGEQGGEPVSLGPEQRARLVLHVRIPAGYRLVSEDDWKAAQSGVLARQIEELKPLATSQATLDFLQMAKDETTGESPEERAVAATRKAHGLEPESDPHVFQTDHEALARVHRGLIAKPRPGSQSQTEGY